MSLDESNSGRKDSQTISVKKSTFNSIIVGLVIAVGITAFLLGTYVTESVKLPAEKLYIRFFGSSGRDGNLYLDEIKISSRAQKNRY